MTADLVAVLDAEGIERATVWGYSRGGWIAYRIAAAHPERVARIVIGGFAVAAHEAELPIQRLGLSASAEPIGRGSGARSGSRIAACSRRLRTTMIRSR